MRIPTRPGITKEEIFGLMVEKMIRKWKKITQEMRQIMNKLADMTVREIERQDG
jgi:hypothetical protein